MKTAGVSFLLLWFSVPLPGTVHGRNVRLVLPAAALEAKDFSDKPSGAVKFFFANQATPRIGAHLGRYAATPKTGAAGNSDERACHEALQWTLVAWRNAPDRPAPMRWCTSPATTRMTRYRAPPSSSATPA